MTDTSKEPSKLEKTIRSWIIKNYQYTLANPQDKRKFNREKVCLNFIVNIFSPNTQPTPQLIGSSKNIYKKQKNSIREKLKRVSKSPKLQSLIKKYPKLNVERAYKYAILSDKFALNNDDIELFEKIIEILALKASKSPNDFWAIFGFIEG